MKHVENFKLNEDKDEYGTQFTVKVKDIIEFLETNFDPESRVYLDHDGWNIHPTNPKNVQELILHRGIFQESQGCLFIQN